MKSKLLVLGSLPFVLSIMGCDNIAGLKEIKFDYIFTAQPVVSATNSTIFKNIQDDFASIDEGNGLITQASIFIKNVENASMPDKIDSFLKDLEGSISRGVINPDLIKEGIESVGSVQEQQDKFGVPGAMAKKVTMANNGFSLGYKNAFEIKDEIYSFVNLLTNNGFETISEDAYYFWPFDRVPVYTDYSDLKILAPTGAPAVALYSLAGNSNFETTSNPQTGLIPQFKTGNYDIIIAPTHGGLTQIIKQNAQYKIAATITFGNFYIVATGNDDDEIMNEGDKVLIFQENDVPGKVFNYLYKDLKLDITAVAAVSDTKLVIENGGVLKL